MDKCIYCGDTEKKEEVELRPYGPDGAWVCFPCATETPEREKETVKAFHSQLDGAGDIVLIGEKEGPYPFEHYIKND